MADEDALLLFPDDEVPSVIECLAAIDEAPLAYRNALVLTCVDVMERSCNWQAEHGSGKSAVACLTRQIDLARPFLEAVTPVIPDEIDEDGWHGTLYRTRRAKLNDWPDDLRTDGEVDDFGSAIEASVNMVLAVSRAFWLAHQAGISLEAYLPAGPDD